MSDLKLGELIDESQQRDAIHVAVAPVVAAEDLAPGQHIGFVIEGDTETVGPIADGPRGFQNKVALGIVDPFLTIRVRKGERFWMFLYPNSITSLRHDWTHPAFAVAPPRTTAPESESRQWLEELAVDLDITYNALMRAAKLWIDEGDHTVEYGSEHWRDTFPRYAEQFWKHYEIVTGTTVKDHSASFFSCSC